VAAYRDRQRASAVAGTLLLAGGMLLLGRSPATVLLAALLGFVVGVTRWRARVDRAIEQRRLRLRIELYTVNQLLAIHVRCGGGVVRALQTVTERGHGVLVDDLRELLALHRSGRPMVEALEQAALATPEPQAARTYRLLATGVEYGADLAEGLRALSDDIRGQRVEALRRAATKRRAAMLVPIIAFLAPVMLLFVAAPLPSIVFAGR
jgi:tight adherence protein C